MRQRERTAREAKRITSLREGSRKEGAVFQVASAELSIGSMYSTLGRVLGSTRVLWLHGSEAGGGGR